MWFEPSLVEVVHTEIAILLFIFTLRKVVEMSTTAEGVLFLLFVIIY